eukprot:g3998.t1
MPQSFQHMPWHEQAPLMYLGLVPSVLEGLSSNEMLTPGYDLHVVLLRQRALNSYPQELVQKTQHALPHEGFQDGDLVISFNGCSSVLGREFCEDRNVKLHTRRCLCSVLFAQRAPPKVLRFIERFLPRWIWSVASSSA